MELKGLTSAARDMRPRRAEPDGEEAGRVRVSGFPRAMHHDLVAVGGK